MVGTIEELDDTSGVGRRGNPYGFDHCRSEQAPQQLQELMQMKTQPKRFAVIKNYIQRIVKERLDPSDIGKNQLPTMKLIGDQLKNEFPRDFGPVAPQNDARLYYAIRCAFQFHRANRCKYLKREEENVFPAAIKAKRKKKKASKDVEEIPRPALAKLQKNPRNLRQTTLRERMAQNLAGTQIMPQDMFPCTDPFQPAPITPMNQPNTQVDKPREVIVIDDSDDDDFQVTAPTTRKPSNPIPKPHAFIERSTIPAMPLAVSSNTPACVKAEPSSPTSPNFLCQPSPSPDKSLDVPAIHNFLQHYCSPPMTEFLARFIENGIRNITRLEAIAGWTPEMRLELFRGLPASPAGFPVTYLDILALQRAFVRLHEEKVPR